MAKNVLKKKITFMGKEYEIDLTKEIPAELYQALPVLEEKDRSGVIKPKKKRTLDWRWIVVRYIPSELMRQIIRTFWFKKIVKEVKSIPVNWWLLLHIWVDIITPDGEELSGFASQFVAEGRLTKELPSIGSIKAIEYRAIKDALKFKYPFFDMVDEIEPEEGVLEGEEQPVKNEVETKNNNDDVENFVAMFQELAKEYKAEFKKTTIDEIRKYLQKGDYKGLIQQIDKWLASLQNKKPTGWEAKKKTLEVFRINLKEAVE